MYLKCQTLKNSQYITYMCMEFVDKYAWLILYSGETLYNNSSKKEGEKVNAKERSKKWKLILKLEIQRRINRNINENITFIENILYMLISNLAVEYLQHPFNFSIPVRHRSMSIGIIAKQSEPSWIIRTLWQY